jgi:hypothetical protein
MMVLVAILSLFIGGFVELVRRRLRETEIQRALLESLQPPGWWPPEWRQELEASFTIEGDVKVAGKSVGAGTVSFILQPGDRVFYAKISRGKYSMIHDRMPTGQYRIEVESLDGPKPQSIKSKWEMPMDQGLHRINLAF